MADDPAPPKGFTVDPDPPKGFTVDQPQGGATGGGTAAPQQQTAPAQTKPQDVPFGEMPDPLAAVAHGLLSVPVEAGRIVNQFGAKPMGWDLSNLVPKDVQRGWEVLGQRAQRGGGTAIGEAIGSAAPFVATGGASAALPWAGRVLTRSVLPAALQPTTGPIDPTTKAIQTAVGSVIGEGLQGIGWLAASPLGKWAESKSRSIAEKAKQEAAWVQQQVHDQLARVISARAPQLAATAARTAARDTEEQARQRAFSTAQADYQKQAQAAAEVEARNQARQQAVDRINQRGTLDYAGQQAQAAAAEARRLDMPRQATQSLLNDARGLIGLRPLEMNLTRETAPQALREVGGELDKIYSQMSFDPNRGGWLSRAQGIQRDIRNRLRQDPRAQALWDEVFKDRAFMPGLRAEAGARPPVTGVAPATIRTPQGQTYRLRSGTPTGDVQGPLGTRSGEVSGDQLTRMMSTLTKAQQRFGLEAQRGGGAVYRDMAEGLARMRQSVENQLDARFPELAEQRQLANQAYFLTSRVMDAIDVHGTATPEQLLNAFKSAEGDTRFGTDRRYSDIKDRLESQHRDYTTPPDKPTAPMAVKGYDEPVPKVGKEPSPPDPLPPIKPVPLEVPKSRLSQPRASGAEPDERLSPDAAHAAGHVAGHVGRMAGIPGLGPLVRGVVRRGGPVVKEGLRGVRDVSRATATPAAILSSRGVSAVADQQRRNRERRQRQRQENQ